MPNTMRGIEEDIGREPDISASFAAQKFLSLISPICFVAVVDDDDVVACFISLSLLNFIICIGV